MTEKHYCSQVCKARCCRVHEPLIGPDACPMLDPDTSLCTIFGSHVGFEFRGLLPGNKVVGLTCSPREKFLAELPEDIRRGCCLEHPELLEETSL